MEALPAFDRPIAHRGLHNRAQGIIENSSSAFAAAIAAGYAFECDVQLSGDDQPIVFHDDHLERLTGQKGRIQSLSAGQLTRLPLVGSKTGDTPQRFEDMLAQIDGQTLAVIELKHQPTPEGTTALAKKVAMALSHYAGPFVIESFDPNLLIAMRKAGFHGHLGIILQKSLRGEGSTIGAFQDFVLRHMLHWPLTRPSFISSHQALPSLPMVRFWRARGVPVTMWTVRSRQEADMIKDHTDQIVFEGFLPDIG